MTKTSNHAELLDGKYITKSVSVTPRDISLIELAEIKADQMRKSFSAFVMDLIEDDIKRDPPKNIEAELAARRSRRSRRSPNKPLVAPAVG